MAAVASAADPTDLMQKLSLDSQSKTRDTPDATKKPSCVQHGPEVASWPVPVSDRSNTPVLQAFLDPNVCYTPNGHTFPAYYYGGNDWEEYPRYLSPGIEMPQQGLYGDMYHGYAYATYGAYGPGSGVAMGHDGQLYNAQHYQYPGAYYQQNAPVYATNASTKPLQANNNSTTSSAENPPLPVDKVKPSSDAVANANAGNGSLPNRPVKNSMPKGSYNRGSKAGIAPPSYQDQRFAYDGMRSPAHWVDAPVFTDMQHQLPTANSISSNISHAGSLPTPRNQNTHHLPPFVASSPQGPVPGFGLASPGYTRAPTHNPFYSQYCNSPRNRQPFGPVNVLQANNRNWFANDNRYNARGRGVGYSYGNENMEVLNELNRGPRAGRFKNGQKSLVPNDAAVMGQGLPAVGVNEDSGFPDRDQYNREDFQENYSDARFFIIKSYSEDDIHKSIKYGVWASTPNGNKKLDDAYKEAQEKVNTCPIFLFFSVNTSGQFVGVGEMVGPVDFNKTVDYWQQDKWTGCFPVKWHIVKDVPNSTLKHIILENNEGKPVTNSRDTQEVRVEQGNQMLKLFKDQNSKTSVLDDFGFYQSRQKIMQAKRVKQQFQKQVWDGKAAATQVWDGKAAPTLASINIDDIAKAKQKIQNPREPVSVEVEETAK